MSNTNPPESDEAATDIREEIDLHEQELATLLCRVLEMPLAPLRDSLGKYKDYLEALNSEVRDLREDGISAISVSQEDSLKALRNLKSQADDSRRLLETSIRELLAANRSELVSSGEAALRALDDRLCLHMAAHGEELAGQIVQLRHEDEIEAERRAIDLRRQLAGMRESLVRLEATAEAMQRQLAEDSEQLTRLHEQSRIRIQAGIDTVMQPVRRMLIATLALTAGTFATLLVLAARSSGLIP